MDANLALSRLSTLLGEERDAIVRLDTAGVDRATEEKQALFAALATGAPLDPGAAARLQALRPTLQQNLILLAHARDCLRDALAAALPGATRGKLGQGPLRTRPRFRLMA